MFALSNTTPAIVLLTALALLGCGDDSGDSTEVSDDGDGPDTALLTHRFGEAALAPFEESVTCVQWTLDNDAALYVQSVLLSNRGYFHHSNWFVVPEHLFPGPDEFFDCDERNFTEFEGAATGTVLFAQSTQSFVEEQRTAPGAVIKVPSRYKVIGTAHMLNVGPAEISTDLFMSLELIHPRDVEIVLTPFRLRYLDLDIPANSQSRFTGVCDAFAAEYEAFAGVPFDMKLHYVLPHYHNLGDYFDLTLLGGSLDGTSVHSVQGFSGEAIGKAFVPPLDLGSMTGLRFTCGYDNWRDVNVGWGIGDQEMCVMLGFAQSEIVMDIEINHGSAAGEVDGVHEFEGPCEYTMLPKNPAQGFPTAAEQQGPLNVPQSGDEGIPPVPECVDHNPQVEPTLAPTLENVYAVVFQPSCTFSACHGMSGQAAGLNLQAPDLLAELLTHEVQSNPGANLIEPGDPQGSWLYERIATCEPQTDSGQVVPHMPRNAPVLLSDRSIALVREWIAAGAMP